MATAGAGGAGSSSAAHASGQATHGAIDSAVKAVFAFGSGKELSDHRSRLGAPDFGFDSVEAAPGAFVPLDGEGTAAPCRARYRAYQACWGQAEQAAKDLMAQSNARAFDEVASFAGEPLAVDELAVATVFSGEAFAPKSTRLFRQPPACRAAFRAAYHFITMYY